MKIKKFEKGLEITTLFLIFMMFIFGIIYFFIGFKNVDLSANLMILKCSYDLNLKGDVGVMGGFYTYEEWYLIGLRQLYYSLLFLIFSFIGLFFYFLYRTRGGYGKNN